MISEVSRDGGLRGLAALGAAALLALAASAGAQVTTFGADLGLPNNVTFDCSVWPVPLVGLVPTGAQTCTWSSSRDLTHTLFVPAGNGTVTQVRVKVGAITGPMQVVVLQGLREEFTNNAGCCQQVGQSQMFTPQANAVTTVPVQLPVRNDIVPDQNHIFAFDILGLSILAPAVPIPAFDTGDHSPSGAYDLADFPASQPNASIQPADPFGIIVLMNADWVPTGTPGPGPGPGGPPVTSGPPLTFETPMALVRRNQAIIDLTCTLAAPCLGDLRLQNQPAPGAVIIPMTSLAGRPTLRASKATPAATRVVTYGRGSFNVPAGATGMVSTRLKPLARRLTRRHRTLQLWANMTLTSTNPAQVVSGQLTLSR